jgi:Bacterial pre-peptidase C-terminal domain/Metallo-peptidase family M12
MKNQLVKFFAALTGLIITVGVAAQVPKLNSYGTASATIFLDFDGHLVSGTSWNVNGAFPCGPSEMNNTQIDEIFNRIAEDFRPFNVNITTDSTKFLSAPLNKRMRIIVTDSSSWYGSAAGVAYVGSFSWGDDTPGFVFSKLLGFVSKKVAEACSHEAGHTLGLQHQATYNTSCGITANYNPGAGTGETSWAPIMGVAYSRNITSWYNGPNPYGCDQMQDELSIITGGANGFGFRADDHTNTFNTATNITLTNNQFAVNASIETTDDQDLFKFTMPAGGRFQLNGIPYSTGAGNSGSNMDVQIELFNAAQVLVNTYNSTITLNAVIDSILEAGTYYLRVDGKGTQFAPDYGSLGAYTLQASVTAANPLPLRQLTLKGESKNEKHSLSWVIDADEVITDLLVEISNDGIHYNNLVSTAAEARTFNYTPFNTGSAFYRLNVTFDNGRQYYSNVVAVDGAKAAAKPKLVSNRISGSNIIISSPGNFEYMIYDMTGKTLQKGLLNNGINTVNAQSYAAGLFMIRYSNGREQWSEKFVKQ